MSAFNPGERVEYAYPDQGEPEEFIGEVVEVVVRYRVKWDSGDIEVMDEHDLRRVKES